MNKHNELMKECIQYFKARRIYNKLFRGFQKKYESLGRLGGTVTLRNPTLEEKEQLNGFFQKDYHNNQSVSISMKKMEQALKDSKFAALTWEEIIEEFFQEKLVAKKDTLQNEKEKRDDFFRKIVDNCTNSNVKVWIEQMYFQKTKGYVFLIQKYNENATQLKHTLQVVEKGVAMFPIDRNQTERLPVFAAKVTGNPHDFDENTMVNQFLLSYIEMYFPKEFDQDMSLVEQKNARLYQAGIIRDDISNYAIAYGIQGILKTGKIHQGVQGFLKMQEPMILTLYTLGKMKDIYSEHDTVYVVENPAVFSWLLEQYPDKSFVCTNGQLRLSSFVLLDFLAKHSRLCYAGDFDPEGLLIAQNLKLRYKDKLKLWKYDVSYYKKYISSVELSKERLHKLERIKIEELQEIKEAMVELGRATYQENMLEELKV